MIGQKVSKDIDEFSNSINQQYLIYRKWQLQYSCLENPRGRGVWQATVCEVETRWTRLTQLSYSARTHRDCFTPNIWISDRH